MDFEMAVAIEAKYKIPIDTDIDILAHQKCKKSLHHKSY